MVSSVGSSSGAMPDPAAHQRKVLPQVSNKVDPDSVRKPRLGALAPPEMLAKLKQVSEAAKGAQAQYNAMARQAAAMTGPPSDFLVASRAMFGLDRFGKFVDSAKLNPLPPVFVDTKA